MLADEQSVGYDLDQRLKQENPGERIVAMVEYLVPGCLTERVVVAIHRQSHCVAEDDRKYQSFKISVCAQVYAMEAKAVFLGENAKRPIFFECFGLKVLFHVTLFEY